MHNRPLALIGTAAATTTLLVGLLAGTATADYLPTADQDYVSGVGSNAIAEFTFQGENAGSTPNTAASGGWRATNAFIDFIGPITCLHVEGNRAGFIYPIEEGSKPEGTVGQAVLIWIEDNGATGDKMGFFGPGPIPVDGPCAPGPTPLDIEGEIVVHDAN